MEGENDRVQRKQYIIEVYDADPEKIKNYENFKDDMNKFIEKMELIVVGGGHDNFTPYGVTLMYTLATSHLISQPQPQSSPYISIHTWPENNFFDIDLYLCCVKKDRAYLEIILKEVFKTEDYEIMEIDRPLRKKSSRELAPAGWQMQY